MLAPVGSGRFTGGAVLEAEDGWRATVLLDRGGERIAVPVAWSVEQPDPAHPVVHSARRPASLLIRAALALTLTLAAAGAASVLATRRRRRDHAPAARRTTSVPRIPAS